MATFYFAHGTNDRWKLHRYCCTLRSGSRFVIAPRSQSFLTSMKSLSDVPRNQEPCSAA